MHIPVLTTEILELFNLKSGDTVIDCTLGAGGHTKAILDKTEPEGIVLAIERDPETLKNTKAHLNSYGKRVIFVRDTFSNLTKIVKTQSFRKVQAIIFDLGFSSDQIADSQRGFSFQKTEPLDMRYDLEQPQTAAKIVNYASKIQLEGILKDYGEEEHASSIVEGILRARGKKEIQTTTDLVKIIEESVPEGYKKQRINSATKTFQALRIATNDELGQVALALPQAAELLAEGGKIAVISFHSLEDRIVKHYFKEEDTLNILTKKPLTASLKELKENPRSRSAKLRVAQKQS